MWLMPRYPSNSAVKCKGDVQPKTVTVPEAANYTGLSESYIRQAIFRRALACVRVGRAVRLLVADLDDFLLAHRQEARCGARPEAPVRRALPEPGREPFNPTNEELKEDARR